MPHNFVVMYPDSPSAKELLNFVTVNKEKFNHGKVLKYQGLLTREEIDKNYRICLSFQNDEVAKYGKAISDYIYANKEHIYESLKIEPFKWGWRESYCTAFGDGGFFTKHTDVIKDGRAIRKLTWVYYFNKTPKPFTGGEIRFFPENQEEEVVEVDSGKLVIFPSSLYHQVEKVNLEENELENFRYTITGFISRKPNWIEYLWYQSRLVSKKILGPKQYFYLKVKLKRMLGQLPKE